MSIPTATPVKDENSLFYDYYFKLVIAALIMDMIVFNSMDLINTQYFFLIIIKNYIKLKTKCFVKKSKPCS